MSADILAANFYLHSISQLTGVRLKVSQTTRKNDIPTFLCQLNSSATKPVTNNHMPACFCVTSSHTNSYPSYISLFASCPNLNYMQICPVKLVCHIIFLCFTASSWNSQAVFILEHPCSLHSSYMISISIYFHFPCEICHAVLFKVMHRLKKYVCWRSCFISTQGCRRKMTQWKFLRGNSVLFYSSFEWAHS